MIKYFCDKCGAEITEETKITGGESKTRLGTEISFLGKKKLHEFNARHTLKLELLVTFDGTCNEGEFCKYCILDTFMKLDDRPKDAPEVPLFNLKHATQEFRLELFQELKDEFDP